VFQVMRYVVLFGCILGVGIGCGGGNSGNSATSSAQSASTFLPAKQFTGEGQTYSEWGDELERLLPVLHEELEGSLYFRDTNTYVQLQAKRGFAIPLRTTGITTWVSHDGALIATVLDGSSSTTKYLDIFGPDGLSVGGFDLFSTTYGYPKTSPDGRFIAIGMRPGYDRYEPVGLYIFDRRGNVVRRFEEDKSANLYYNDWEWTPDGRLLLAVSRSVLVLEDIRNGSPTRVRQFIKQVPGHLAASPDSTQIAFSLRDEDSNEKGRQLYLMGINGTGLRSIATYEGGLDSPAWSPDGLRLAFKVAQPQHDTCTAIYILPATARDLDFNTQDLSVAVPLQRLNTLKESSDACATSMLIWRPSQPLMPSRSGTLPEGSGANSGLSGTMLYQTYSGLEALDMMTGQVTTAKLPNIWGSPHASLTGSEVLVVHRRAASGHSNHEQISILGIDGTTLNSFELHTSTLSQPRLSADGRRIALTWNPLSSPANPGQSVGVTDRRGNEIISHPGYDLPEWLPDGRLLMIKDRQVYVTDHSLRNPKRLFSLTNVPSRMSASPDGTRLAFNMVGRTWVINIDGSEMKQLTDRAVGLPTWSPDSQHLAVTLRTNDYCTHIYVIPTDGERIRILDDVLPGTALLVRRRYETGQLIDSTCPQSALSWY
jgi:Tol biopolymer transport system component